MCCGNSHDPREGLWKGTMTKINEEKVFLFEKSININLKEMLSISICISNMVVRFLYVNICLQ